MLVEANIIADADAFDPEALEDYADAAEVNVQNAISTLATQRALASDAAVEKAVTDAQADVNANELGDPLISDTPSTTRYDADGAQLTPLYAASGNFVAETDTDATLAGYLADGETAPLTDGTVSVDGYAGFESTVFTARQLQQRVESAQATLASHEASNGATLELAGELNDAIALYEAAGGADLSGGELAAIQTNYDAVVALVEEDGSVTTANQAAFAGALADWADAVAAAQTNLTLETGAGELDDIGSRDNVILDLLTTLDKRVELIGELGARELAFLGELDDAPFATTAAGYDEAATTSGDSVGNALLTAQAALDTREGHKDALGTAQQQQTDLVELSTTYEDATAAVTAIEEELGFTVEKLDSGIEFATDEADLFTFDLADFTDEDGLVTLDSVIMNGVSTDDVLFFFGDYQLGTEGSADNNVQEIFFTEINGNAVIQVEATNFGSQNDNFVELTLSGITQDQLSFENGAVFITEVA